MPKPVYSTAGEVNALKAELKDDIASCKATVQPAVQAAEGKLRAELQGLSNDITKNASTSQAACQRTAADAKQYTEATAKSLQQQLQKGNDELAAGIKAATQQVEAKLAEANESTRHQFAEELTNLCNHFEKEIEAVKANAAANLEKLGTDVAENIVQNRRELDAIIAELRKEVVARDEELKQNAQQERQKIVDDQQKSDTNRDERSERAQAEIHLKLERLEEVLHEHSASHKDDAEHKSRVASESLTLFRDEAGQRLDALDQEASKLRDAVAEVENISTRRVDWIIQNVGHKVRPSTPSKASLHRSWFSPKFNAAGAHGLQLELQLFKPSELPVDGESAGDCGVYLWACKGMNLSFKLYIGTKSTTLEKVFNGRVPYGVERLCFIKDHINREDDTLRVSVEILESVREVEHPIEMPPPPDNPLELQGMAKSLEGLILFRRQVNNRLLDQVKSQVEIMNSRMVRKIEWRVEKASLLRQCFGLGESICSSKFNAAGIEGMQLIFYPSGYTGATDGFCSFFLFAPAGATLRCWLCAGSQKREANHSFEEPGAFGRTNFCRYEGVIEESDDSVLLGLEVEEAHQDLCATVAHPVLQPGDRRTQSQLDGSVPSAVESVVKLQRVPGKSNPGLDERRVLPSLWTAKSLGDKHAPADGFHSFDDLKSRGGASRRGGGDPVSPASVTMLNASRSLPSLKEASDRTVRDGGEKLPLPLLIKTSSGDWAHERNGSRLKKARSGTRKDWSLAQTAVAM